MLIRFFLIISMIKNFFAIPFSLNPVTFVRGQKSQKITYKIEVKKKKKKKKKKRKKKKKKKKKKQKLYD